MTIKLEKVVNKFYDGLEEGKILGRKCPQCVAMVKTLVLPAPLSSKPEYKNLGKFAYGEVELKEGTTLNAVIRGVSRKNKAELAAKLPLPCHAAIFQREGGFKTVVFDLDE